jgi:glycine dehydrogenase
MTDTITAFDAITAQDRFASRHIGPDADERAAMLEALEAPSLDALIRRIIPEAILSDHALDLRPPLTEGEILDDLRTYAAKNQVRRSLIGLGYHATVTPLVILRNVLENPGWYTAYTPYQAEIAQGRLEALLNFQTMMAELAGMAIANASLLDEATAAAEGVALAHAVHKGRSTTIAVASDLHPQTRAVIATRAAPLGWTLTDIDPNDTSAIESAAPFALVLQYPGTTGAIRDLTAEIAAAHAAGALAIVAADPLALALLKPPGEMGADIVVGTTQRFGVPMGFGGPHAAYFATRDSLKRHMAGRLVGVSIDAAGNPALRLALQTREQHIRREKATSNICTAQVLLAVIAGFYGVWHGPDGLRRIATRIHFAARILAAASRFPLRHSQFFDTIALETGDQTDAIMAAALHEGFNLRRIDATGIAIALDEAITRTELETLTTLIGANSAPLPEPIPAPLARRTTYMTAPVFHAHRSEHEMLRYLKRLEDKDIALNRSMIPLGSCTMKLNATAEMIPITWRAFADIHPFAPPDQTRGYTDLIDRLAADLARITGFAAVSLQPNSGAQGEYAGLLSIRAWHESRGDTKRDICLIPSSAHGTNPASATMAGYRVVVIGCDKAGNIDLADLDAKITLHADRLAALMITYPSTHGVFEATVRTICDRIHAAGGQVYMDGANMNAQVGLTSPAAIGADVCHLNLHKTFCIPHGGGGPGIGPIGVAAHLAPHLPNHPLRDDAGPATGYGPIAAAPFGSASILPIPYAYIRMMGPEGLREATSIAILNANYIAHRLAPHYPILYTGAGGMVAHECIIDCRGFQPTTGIQVEDIAKRLQDYGFHAPTMSWPVPGTLMIEPTESETKAEIDRFCDAMIAIRTEIAAIAATTLPRDDNPLKNAPHTAAEITATTWTHPYTREQAAFPLAFVQTTKYWPPVKRVDNVYGDRNLVCSCAPMADYATAAE